MNKSQRNGARPSQIGGRRWCWQRCTGSQMPACLIGLLALGMMLTVGGCEQTQSPARAPGVAPMPTYTGPAYLRGTIGSLVRLRPGTDRPQLVSGYGIVVNLNGTGSTSVPPALRQAMINQMKKYGLGSANLDTLNMSPERVLADANTAVVRIDALIPPGSTKGTRFDVLVTAIDSQTTSLDGGLLWTATLGVNGADQAFRFMREQATAYGPIYRNPYNEDDSGEPSQFGKQQAMVVAGGTASSQRELDLVLNQASYTRCRAIADRINDRFGRTDDLKDLAKPVTDQLIKINIPPRYEANPGELVELIMHLYLQAGPGFEQHQAGQLAEVLKQGPEAARSVRLAWQALGRPIVQTLREYYEDPQLHVRLTALEAGAWLKDERASQSLSELAKDLDPEVRTRAAKALMLLPRSLNGARTLKKLLDDSDTSVRIAAYESLSAINDQLILDGRVVVPDDLGTGVKYIIDTVPAESPMVYVSQVGVPRIVVFSPDLGFESPLLARLWNNRLMLAMSPDQGHLDIFYQPAVRTNPNSPSSIKLKAQPDLKTLIYLMGHKPTRDHPHEGLALTYSQVVNAVYQLCMQDHVDAPIEVVVGSLAKQIDVLEDTAAPQLRPETGGEALDGDAAAPNDETVGRPDTSSPPGVTQQSLNR